MTNIKKKAYESPKLTAEGTIAGLTQGDVVFPSHHPSLTLPSHHHSLSGSPATTAGFAT